VFNYYFLADEGGNQKHKFGSKVQKFHSNI